jgi:hypothetical protein
VLAKIVEFNVDAIAHLPEGIIGRVMQPANIASAARRC